MMIEAGGARAPVGVSLPGWVSFATVPLIALLMFQQGVYGEVPTSFVKLVSTTGVLLGMAAFAARSSAGIPSIACGAAAILFVYYCGPASASAFALLASSALAAGSVFDPHRAWLASSRLLTGLAALVALVGWLLPFPLHDGRVYLLVVVALCWWRRDHLARDWRAAVEDWRCLANEVPAWLLLVVGAAFVAGLGLWLPSLNYDDNSAHLILPYQLLGDGYYHLDVSTQVWAVAPWTNNVLHGIAALLAGQEARPAANLLWLLVGLGGAWRLARSCGASPATGLAAAAVYASLPLTGYFTTAMQVDGASAAVLLHLVASLVTAGRTLPPALAMSAVFALLAGLKASNVVYAMPAVAWLSWLALKQRNIRWLAVVAASAVLMAGASYFYAAWVTGNPLFPLFNSVFKSPYYPAMDFVDPRWHHGVDWRFFWDATVHTDRYGEVYPGAWGFALLALLPAILLGAFRQSSMRWVAAWFMVTGLVVFAQVQYLRYVFPPMALLVVIGVVGLGRELKPSLVAIAALVLVFGNLLLLPTTSWMARENPWQELLLGGKSTQASIEARMAPARVLVQRALARDVGACILVADAESPYIAVAGGRAQSVKDSYDPRMARAFEWANADASGSRWRELLDSTAPTHVLTGATNPPLLLAALTSAGYAVRDREGGLSAWSPVDASSHRCSSDLERVRDEAHRRLHPGDVH